MVKRNSQIGLLSKNQRNSQRFWLSRKKATGKLRWMLMRCKLDYSKYW